MSGGREAGRAEAGAEGGPGPALCGCPSPTGSWAWKLVSMDPGDRDIRGGLSGHGVGEGAACRFRRPFRLPERFVCELFI